MPKAADSAGGRIKGPLAALVIGFVLVGGAELLARGLLRNPPLTLGLARVDEVELRTVNPQYPRQFFRGALSGRQLQGVRMASQPYLRPDPRRPLRVLFAGGSTVQGYPHPRRLAAAAYLEAMLADGLSRPVEVFNLGITAVSSFVVARTVEAALGPLEADLVVVYTGHNEIYGVYGAGSGSHLSAPYWERRLHYALVSSGLGGAIVTLMASAPATPVQETMLQILGRAGNLAAQDPRRQEAADLLRRNLEDIAGAAAAAGVPLALCTVVSNETGFAPAAGLPPDAHAGLRQRLREAARQDSVSSVAAADLLARAQQVGDAELIFSVGRLLQRHRQPALAAAAFRRARNLDPAPWRATDHLNEIIRDVAHRRGAVLVDPEPAFRALSPPEGIGWRLMSDHLHPSAEGQLLLARVIVAALQQASPPVPVVAGLNTGRLATAAEYRRRQGAFDVEEVAVAAEMAAFFSRPPLATQSPGAAAGWRRRADTLAVRLPPAQRQALATWPGIGSGKSLALGVAERLFAAGDYVRAAEYYRVTRLDQPFTIEADLWPALRQGMSLRLALGSLPEDARAAVEQARRRERFLAQAPEYDAAFGAFFQGYAAYLLGEAQTALPLLLQAAADADIRRSFPFDLMAALVDELVAAGRVQDAVDYVKRITQSSGRRELGDRFLRRLEAMTSPAR